MMWHQCNVMCDNGKESWMICVHSEDWLLRYRLDKHARSRKLFQGGGGGAFFVVDEGIQIPLKPCQLWPNIEC